MSDPSKIDKAIDILTDLGIELDEADARIRELEAQNAALTAALEQLRIDAGDAGMDDTVEFISAALSRQPGSGA